MDDAPTSLREENLKLLMERANKVATTSSTTSEQRVGVALADAPQAASTHDRELRRHDQPILNEVGGTGGFKNQAIRTHKHVLDLAEVKILERLDEPEPLPEDLSNIFVPSAKGSAKDETKDDNRPSKRTRHAGKGK